MNLVINEVFPTLCSPRKTNLNLKRVQEHALAIARPASLSHPLSAVLVQR